ncbi:MAG: hypothetical protein IH576_04160 [Deltaproteobacteria bacterium]|nr:hypothetical protein [Deltaproteobacteria bacterium]
MNEVLEALCLRLLDLARGQKSALDAGNLDEVLALAEKRQRILREIQKIDSPGTVGKSTGLTSVIRQVLSLDGEAGGVARAQMQVISKKTNEFNTFKVFCQGVLDEARLRGVVPAP